MGWNRGQVKVRDGQHLSWLNKGKLKWKSGADITTLAKGIHWTSDCPLGQVNLAACETKRGNGKTTYQAPNNGGPTKA